MRHELIDQVSGAAVAVGGVPGIVVELREGRQSEFVTAGVGDLQAQTARAPEERFRIGSLTKAFTAVLALQLVAEGKVALDDAVERWLPGLVHGSGHDGAEVTIANLLQQTSGIFNYSLDPDMLADFFCPRFLDTRFDHYSPEQLINVAMAHRPLFRPGKGWRYSNTNYVLIGMIIEAVTEITYADNVIERISGPLGLDATFVPEAETLPSPHCRHYSRDTDGVIHDVTEQSPSTTWAAGGIVSTTEDLGNFMTGLLGGKIVDPVLSDRMFATVSTIDSGWIPHTRYGLGIFAQTLPDGTQVWGGGGAVNGSWTYCMGSRDGTRVVTAHVNGDWADNRWNNPIEIFTDLLDIAFSDQ